MLARSFLIESSSKLLVTRTGIKARSSSILGRIGPLILELLALEWRKFYPFELDYMLCLWTIYFRVICLDCWKDHIWPWHIGLKSEGNDRSPESSVPRLLVLIGRLTNLLHVPLQRDKILLVRTTVKGSAIFKQQSKDKPFPLKLTCQSFWAIST